MKAKRNITVDARSFLIPGTYIWMKFIEHGWVPVIVREITDRGLLTDSIHSSNLPVNVEAWFLALKQGNIMISPN